MAQWDVCGEGHVAQAAQERLVLSLINTTFAAKLFGFFCAQNAPRRELEWSLETRAPLELGYEISTFETPRARGPSADRATAS